MTVYEQLAAIESLLNDLLAEPDKEILRARLREGPYPRRAEIEARNPKFPFEAFAAGTASTVSILAQRLRDRIHAELDLPASKVVVGQRVISTSVEPADPPPRSEDA